jgi:glutaredoxin 3
MVKQLVEQAIKSNKVIVFSKSYCPYCVEAKRILSSKGTPFELFELDQRTDGSAIQQYLQSKTGQRTVPNIFINQGHIGGCDDLKSAERSKKLDALLA